jgi:hypothetical protein
MTKNVINRAILLHNKICGLLMTSYEYLQDHIFKMSSYLNEFEKQKLKIGIFSFFFW